MAVERRTIELIEHEAPARWGGYHPVAVDDTKLHRASEAVWGTCTFHESAARSPNRAETVRAHNWVVMGDLLPGRPWTFLAHSGRLYLRKSQLPEGEVFRTKTAWAVEMLGQVDAESEAPVLGVCDGAYAMETVVRPCLQPPPGRRRIEIVTRLRVDARLYHPLLSSPQDEGKKVMGRPRKWGRRIAAPQHHDQWDAPWQKGAAWIYGRVRKIRYKRVRCQWSVSGPDERVHAFVFEVEGYDKPWFLVTTALDLSSEQVVEAFAARFRQEDGFRDHKQRLGMEECRAWTKQPVLRTFQVQMTAMTLLRLMQFRLDAAWGEGSYWLKPQWNRRKQHPSILDLRRLFWRHRAEFSKLLLKLEEIAKVPPASIPAPNPREIAA
ncbi:MAG: transposase [Planctomycetota bacterium]